MTKLNDRVTVATYHRTPKTPEATAAALGTVVGFNDYGVPYVIWDSGIGHGYFPAHELRVHGNAMTDLAAAL